MSQATIMKKSQLFAAVTAMGASGLLTVPVPAQADPMFPQAPACVQWGLTGVTVLQHTNGWTASFNATGQSFSAPASAIHTGGGELSGTVDGGIDGRTVGFQMRWNNGAIGKYEGTVGDDGIAKGSTVDLVHPENKAEWNTRAPLSCLKTEEAQPVVAPPDEPPVVAPPPPPPPETRGVSSDTNVYDKPSDQGGRVVMVNGQILFLDAEVDRVTLVGACTKKIWCTVINPKIPLPNNKGAVWGGDLEVPEG